MTQIPTCRRGRFPRGLPALPALLVALALLLATSTAHAGSYLDRAALLLSQASIEADFLRGRLSDRPLATVVHQMSEARLAAADHMEIPKEVKLAHPHLLLVLENYERAADAAALGEANRFLVLVRRAHEEEHVLRSVLQQLGWTIPSL